MSTSGTITATTTAASLGLVTAGRSAIVQADPDNTADVLIGTSLGSQSFQLRPGAALQVPITDGGLLYAKSTVGSQDVNWWTSPEPAPLQFYPSTLPSSLPTTITGTISSVAAVVCPAAGDYAAADVISNSTSAGVAWVFPSAARFLGGKGVVRTAFITFSQVLVVATTRINLFSANPSASELRDNVAYAVNAADIPKQIGHIDFAAVAGGRSFSQNVYLPYACAAADDALYGILQFIGAEANESTSMTVSVGLGVDRLT